MNNKTDPLEKKPLEGILGNRTAAGLYKYLELETVSDLLTYFPRKCFVRGRLTAISALPLGQDVTLLVEVVKSFSRSLRSRKGEVCDVTVVDGDDKALVVSFFNAHRARQELKPGRQLLLSGKVSQYRGKITLSNPDFMVLSDNGGELSGSAVAKIIDRPIPIYPATAKISSWAVAEAIRLLLQGIDLDGLEDPVPEEVCGAEKIPSLSQAYRMIHQPESEEDYRNAKRRFRFQEAFILQTALLQRRNAFGRQKAAPRYSEGDVGAQFDGALPFDLTGEQVNAGRIIAQRLQAPHPMNVLLQGDVGSGKTIVALRAMLQAVSGGGQAVLLAPTEVLATQHFYSILNLLGDLGQETDTTLLGIPARDGPKKPINVSLLIGSLSDRQRKAALLDIASGAANIIVGTHAVQSKDVSYFDLALVVVDEQHRFGVEQRDALRQKERNINAVTGEVLIPHVLTMTATPIPRTVAMMVFGDLEMVTLKRLPAGRQAITTHIVDLRRHPSWYDRIWERAAEEIRQGRQVYVVCPTIFADGTMLGESDTKNIASVEKIAAELADMPMFADTGIGILHGSMDPGAKAETMHAFENNDINMLVATTMVEVGVDVSNATLMVILDAERFGMSQLHQLRGRVGRGKHAGTCLLVTESSENSTGTQRLEAVAATTDGFKLAHEDMKLRREGDILGTNQWGKKSALKFLRVVDHSDTVESARSHAARILREDPQLMDHQELKGAIDAALGQQRGQFLEQA